MAVTASGLYLLTFIDALDTTQLALDLTLTTHKVAMFTNTITPNFSTDTAFGSSPYNANEVSGAGYTTGGKVLGSTPTLTESPTGSIKWDAPDVAWTSSTITNARFGLIYADALGGNNAIAGINFGGDFSTSSGTFTIVWPSGGIAVIDVTP